MKYDKYNRLTKSVQKQRSPPGGAQVDQQLQTTPKY